MSRHDSEEVNSLAVRAIIKRGRFLIRDEKRWAKKSCAEDVNGIGVGLYDDSAYSFCGHAAALRSASDIQQTGDSPNIEKAYEYLYKFAFAMLPEEQKERIRQTQSRLDDFLSPLVILNDLDNTTHEQILTVFDQAFAKASGLPIPDNCHSGIATSSI